MLYVVVRLFFYMYRHFEIVVLQCDELDLILRYLLVLAIVIATIYNGWLQFKLGSCGAVGSLFVYCCDSSYVF